MSGFLLIDAGSTKTRYALLTKESDILRFHSKGINPFHISSKEITDILLPIKNCLPDVTLTGICFFGAGCASPQVNRGVESLIREVFDCSQVSVDSDLAGAAKALFGDGKGITCILGTGSNSCVYEKGKIVSKIPSLGYVLGDEGSGVALGKALLNAVFKRTISQEIIDKFQAEYNLSVDSLIERVYRQPSPASFIASFSHFISANIEKQEISDLVEKEFEKFIVRDILPFGLASNLEAGFVGSVAFHFQDILKKCCSKYKIPVASIIADPLPALEKYYS